jgi:CMP-N-acetylneuraminic acid synthetase
LRLLDNLPLIAHSIAAALESKLLHQIWVSTEDEEIAEVAVRAGAQVLARPQSLAGDEIQNTDVVRHVLQSVGPGCSHVVLLQPTSPLRTGTDIDACLRLLQRPGVRSAMTVTMVEHHPGKAIRLDADGFVRPFTNWTDMEARRQRLEPLYRQNGAVYALGAMEFLRENRFILEPCAVHVMNPRDSVDIDSELDLMVAEALLEQRKKHNDRKGALNGA